MLEESPTRSLEVGRFWIVIYLHLYSAVKLGLESGRASRTAQHNFGRHGFLIAPAVVSVELEESRGRWTGDRMLLS